ncbi:unnamed protein product [Paramecium octaurelia]|uniref:Uncharacterized protein n=1 Tax=Paramecium octaurelia TaxID=43137 RepID=A0A8S1YKU9_PAROT|nr:unnamed protein product [Paramecium octaurelia]
MLLEIMEVGNACFFFGICVKLEAIIMCLLLIKQCINVILFDKIRVDDPINRMNINQISFIQKVQTLLIIIRKFKERTAEFKAFMIKSGYIQICRLNLLQNVYQVLYYWETTHPKVQLKIDLLNCFQIKMTIDIKEKWQHS